MPAPSGPIPVPPYKFSPAPSGYEAAKSADRAVLACLFNERQAGHMQLLIKLAEGIEYDRGPRSEQYLLKKLEEARRLASAIAGEATLENALKMAEASLPEGEQPTGRHRRIAGAHLKGMEKSSSRANEILGWCEARINFRLEIIRRMCPPGDAPSRTGGRNREWRGRERVPDPVGTKNPEKIR